MQDYTMNWPMLVAIAVLAVVMWLATLARDWAERNRDDDD